MAVVIILYFKMPFDLRISLLKMFSTNITKNLRKDKAMPRMVNYWNSTWMNFSVSTGWMITQP